MSADPPHLPSTRVILKHAEVMADAAASRSRGSGGGTWFTLALLTLLCLAVELGHLGAFWLVQQLPLGAMFVLGPWLPIVVPAALAFVAVKISLDLEQRRASHAYLRSLGAAGAPLEREGVYEITPEALVLTTERVVLAPRWRAIDAVECGRYGWVISADHLHFLIPFAAFADAAAQRPLLSAITTRLTPEARARSRSAVAFAEEDGKVTAADDRVERAVAASAPPDQPIAIEASGWLTQEQASWAANVIYSRVARLGFHRFAYPLTGGATGLCVGLVILGVAALVVPRELIIRHPFGAFAVGAFIMLACTAYGLGQAWRRLGIVAGKAWQAGLSARGVPDQIEARWSLTATGLAYRTARFSGEAAYASIHQVLHEHGYWIAACDALTVCIPDGAFAEVEHARAFMATLLDRIGADARGRSVTLQTIAS